MHLHLSWLAYHAACDMTRTISPSHARRWRVPMPPAPHKTHHTHHTHPRPPQGTSRGGANIREIVRRIDLWGLDMVFVVGGNGGNAAADAINAEVERCGLKCAVAGVPKSIDNDILLVDK